ncbi:MAG: DUF116 domain-containing protein [Chloroflexota bacterium]
MIKPYQLDEEFYDKLANFSRRFTDGMLPEFQHIIDDFKRRIESASLETLRSDSEYFIEILAIGVFASQYSKYSRGKSVGLLKSLEALKIARTRSLTLKPAADRLRGVLFTHFLYKPGNDAAPFGYREFCKLLEWMNATGEFDEEVIRLRNWSSYLKTLPAYTVESILTRSLLAAQRFEREANDDLGGYVSGARIFLDLIQPTRRNREDVIFTGRKPIEYLFNMFAAQVLNEALAAKFATKENLSVLMPACAKSLNGQGCKATGEGLDMVCAGCSGECNIGKVKRALPNNAKVYIVPHSSGFSDFLKRRAVESDVAVVGIACTLNLLRGGYEMMRLGIPSQCVFLDFPGCKKHWSQTGTPTEIHVDQLLKLLRNNKAASAKSPYSSAETKIFKFERVFSKAC